MAARAIHMASDRSRQEFVAVNCTALPDNLLEAELFGHVKGAFTGAFQNRIGRFEQAHRGSIFLDEIGDMPLDLQAKLLRVLQEREFQRLGSSETVKVDVRVIAASNMDLAARVRQGKFREDLYYRINVVPLVMPPLRERKSDIRLLADYLIAKVCRQEGVAPKQTSVAALETLLAYDWPGNVRQLENCVETAIAMSGNRAELRPEDFQLAGAQSDVSRGQTPVTAVPPIDIPNEGLDFEATVGQIELNLLEQALRRTGGNKKLAADMLGLKRTTLSAKLRSFGTAIARAAC
jgi:transcriptional regulator with GAF, ATPase, and Fis domain